MPPAASASSPSPTIVWFRRNLRLADNPALAEAARRGPVLPVFILRDSRRWSLGGAARWWLHQSLAALAADLQALGVPLVLRRGQPAQVLADLAAESGAQAVFRDHYGDGLTLDGIEVCDFGGYRLFDGVRTQTGQMFQVFTPFWRACLQLPPPPLPLPRPDRLQPVARPVASDRLEDWGLLPTAPDWAGGLRQTWTPGEAAARERLEWFLDHGIEAYAAQRDRPEVDGTSRLSPHLAFGEISPRQIWHAVRARPPGNGADTFLKELGWREFYLHLLAHNPTLPDRPMKPEFERLPWAADEAGFQAWCRGRTGYPIVDAGMRQLWQTGWMHNRVRMIVASFLVKDLLVPWQRGEEWFWDTLVDADLASNAGGWQWVAGCGTDAAPYFRVFNPVLQGEKFDPRGRYVRQWVPELARVPDLFIHRPWEAPDGVLRQAGVELGQSYPRPMVDHGAARRRALTAYEQLRADAGVT